MIVAFLAGRPLGAVCDALLSHGWEGDLSRTSTAALEPLALEALEVPPETLEALVPTAGRFGLDVVTGEGWAVLAGARARLSALAGSGTLPAALSPLVQALGAAMPGDEPNVWRTAHGPVSLDRPVLVGVLNVTPDSFSDAGRWATVEAAVARGEQLLQDGARILDVGGESTRPARPAVVDEEEERRRTIPVIAALARRFPGALISIDTVKAGVARTAAEAGAAIINDVSAGRLDPEILRVAAQSRAGLVLMHSRGDVSDMASYDHAHYPAGVVPAVVGELRQRLEAARLAGVEFEATVVDPGLGFAKTPLQSITLCRQLGALRALGRPILVGPSRKRFIGELTGQPVERRDLGTAAACLLAWQQGARLFRVHEVVPTRDALAVAAGIERIPLT